MVAYCEIMRRIVLIAGQWLVAMAPLISLACQARASESAVLPQPADATPGAERPTPTVDPAPRLNVSTSGWKTDFSRFSVSLSEIQSGGPPRDGIPPIDRPRFVTPDQAASWVKPQEPVVALELLGDARAYPLQILIWHEIVNDEVGGIPVSVTFCPLCNTALAFDRRLGDQVLDFGTTGNLRLGDLVMWDRQTESWWQQATGEAIVGAMTGTKLTFVPAGIVSFAEFRRLNPAGQVLSRETGFNRSYGRNPYQGYDDIQSSPFLFSGRIDSRLRPMERVVAISINEEDVAYAFRGLERARVVMDTVGGRSIVVMHAPGTVSALDRGDIAESRDIGASGVYDPAVDGRPLRFRASGEAIIDEETGSQWSVLGRATAGPLAGRQLEPVVHGNHFWFSIAAFKPNVQVRLRAE